MALSVLDRITDPAKRARLEVAMAGMRDTDIDDLLETQEVLSAQIVTLQQDRALWLHGREPLPFDEFCRRLDNNALYPRQIKPFVDAGMIPARSWIQKNRLTQEFVLCWGKGAGKDWVAAKVTAYMAYVILNLREDPAIFYGLSDNDTLSVVNIAPTEKQARTIFFRYLKKFLSSDVFTPFITAPKRQIHADDIQFFRHTLNGSEYIPLEIISLHSRAASLEGKNIIWWTMDEADAFLNSGDKSNGDELHDILRSSASTRFAGYWGGMVISYPRVAEGFLMRLIDRAKESDRRAKAEGRAQGTFYWDVAPTWEVNPKFDRYAEEVVDDYANDPSHARALYECIPMATLDGFIEFPERIDLAVNHARQPAAYVREDRDFEITSGDKLHRYVTVKMTEAQRTPGHTYFLGGDAGVKRDSYALAIFHTEDGADAAPYICQQCAREDPDLLSFARYIQQPQGTTILYREDMVCAICFRSTIEAWATSSTGAGDPMNPNATMRIDGWWIRADAMQGSVPAPVVQGNSTFALPNVYEDLLLCVKPVHASRQGEANRVVYLPGIQEVVIDLVRGLGIRQARFDPHQAQQCVQSLQSATNCDSGEISFANAEQLRRGRLTKAMLYAGKIELLPNPERDREWRRLQIIGAGKLDHPENGSKDLWDAETIAIWLAATHKNSELLINWS